MSYELVTNAGLQGQFASLFGLEDLTKAAKGPALKKFLHDGISEDVDEVIAELEQIHEPPDVAHTAETLAALAKGAKEILITDGVNGDEGIEDEKPEPKPKKVAAGDLFKHQFGVVMIPISPKSTAGAAMAKVRESIHRAHLRAKGLETDSHVTLRYGFSGDTGALRAYLQKQEAFTARFGKTFAFEATEHSDGACPLCVSVYSDELIRMNEEIAERGSWKEADFDYQPHATLAYVDPDEVDAYIDRDDLTDYELVVMGAVITSADGVSKEVVGFRHHEEVRKRASDSATARERMEKNLRKHFIVMADTLANVALSKAAIWDLSKAADDSENLLQQMFDALDWEPLSVDVQQDLLAIAQTGGLEALHSINIFASSKTDSVNQAASDWAETRAAEMVGMRRVNGVLVENPDARWAISETTRNQLRAIVEDAFDQSISMKQLAKEIQEAGTFSPARAKMIARTESAMARRKGQIFGWKESGGVVTEVDWVLNPAHDFTIECACPELAEGSPYPLDEVPELAHPNDSCSLRARIAVAA